MSFVDTFATLVGTRATFILDKMPPRRCLTNEVHVEETYERDHMARLEQQMEALMQQFQAFFAIEN